jgi:hypothetical protein
MTERRSRGVVASGILYTRIACQNALNQTFNILSHTERQWGAESGHTAAADVEGVDSVGPYAPCPNCGGLFPPAAIVAHKERCIANELPVFENAACILGGACCLCTGCLSWLPYCGVSCYNSHKKYKPQ